MKKLSGVVMSLVMAVAATSLGGCAAEQQDLSDQETATDDSELAATKSLTVTTPPLKRGESYLFQVSSSGRLLSGRVVGGVPTGLGVDSRTGVATLAASRDGNGRLKLMGAGEITEVPGPEGFHIRILGIDINIRITVKVDVTIP